MPQMPPVATPRPRQGLGWVWLLILCALGTAGYFLYPKIRQWPIWGQAGAGTAGAPTTRPVPVGVAAVKKADLSLYLTGLGTVTPLNTVTVRSRVDGQLIEVPYREGQLVQEGALLAQIDPRPFKVQLAQAEGQMARDQAQLKNAKLDLERYKQLLKETSVTQQQVDTQAAVVGQLEGTVLSDQAQIDNANLQLTYCRITSPLTGRIGLRVVDQGNMIHASDASGLAVITQLQPIAIVFNLPQDGLPAVQKAIKTNPTLPVDAYSPDLKTRLASGKLLTIDNQIDPTTGTVKLKAVFDNEDESLFPNQFVNARLLVDTLRGAIIVPNAAVQRGPGGMTFVYVVQADNTVKLRNIVPGPTEGDETAIESGLAPGESVVTDGVDKLRDGTSVVVGRPGASTRPAGAGAPATRPAGAATRSAAAGMRTNAPTTQPQVER